MHQLVFIVVFVTCSMNDCGDRDYQNTSFARTPPPLVLQPVDSSLILLVWLQHYVSHALKTQAIVEGLLNCPWRQQHSCTWTFNTIKLEDSPPSLFAPSVACKPLLLQPFSSQESVAVVSANWDAAAPSHCHCRLFWMFDTLHQQQCHVWQARSSQWSRYVPHSHVQVSARCEMVGMLTPNSAMHIILDECLSHRSGG